MTERHILLLKTSSLGDVIHALPALTDAASALPGIRFDWVVEEGFAEIPHWHPAVDQVIPVALRRWRKHPLKALSSGEWPAFKRAMSQRQYDLVIDAQGLLKSAWISCYARGPVAGLDRGSIREPLASRLYRYCYPVPWGQHAVERVRQLFAQALDYPVPEGIGNYGLDRIRIGVSGERENYLVFLHGTTWVTKHWPEHYWRLLLELAGPRGWPVRLPWGNEREKVRAERLASGLPHVRVLPRLSLKEMAGVLACARGCVAVDTGLGHLAAALDVPTLSLFGPTNPLYTGAYGINQGHLPSHYPHCAPCLQKRCSYRPTTADRLELDTNRIQPLCFAHTAPELVATKLEMLLTSGVDASIG